jgi:hypothetical protein
LGWADGRNVRIDVRWAGGDTNRIPALAQELVGLRPDIILTSDTPATVALQRETRTIPIVFAGVGDPRPRAQPSGRIAPGLKRAAIMFNPETTTSAHMPSFATVICPSVVTSIGPIAVRCPRVRDRAGAGTDRIRFSSAILPTADAASLS